MAKSQKPVISWPYFWNNRVTSITVEQGAKANVILTITKPIFGFVPADFTVIKQGSNDVVNSVSTSANGLVITITVANAFAVGNSGSLTLTKGIGTYTTAITNNISS